MLKIKIPFGFKTITFDYLLTVYTGKIRIKANANDLSDALKDCEKHITYSNCRNNCTMITFCTTDALLNRQLMDAINSALADIMHKRIDLKYRSQYGLTDEMIDDYLNSVEHPF